jgi:hypothetical protein
VRPAFGPEGKGDSHWVCLNVLPYKNVWHYYSDNSRKDYYLPTGIGTNWEHMQNLAEMLYAIYNPALWEDNVRNIANTGLEMFYDFDKTKYTLHNQYFWKNVQRKWREKEILKKAFNFSGSDEEFRELVVGDEKKNGNGLHLLYSGYSWLKSISWNASLYESIYNNGTANKQKNMHLNTTKEVTRNMREIDIDCRVMGRDSMVNYYSFFNDNAGYRWTVRHATGRELASDGRYNEKTAITGVDEVYRYYNDVLKTNKLMDDPEVTPAPKTINKDNVEVGNIIAESGSFYRNCADAKENQDEPVAMVVYLGGTNRVEKGKDWNGLAIALKDVKDERTGSAGVPYCGNEGTDALCTTNIVSQEHLAKRCDGWAMTQRLKNHTCGANHKHEAAETAWNKDRIEGCSEWFIPSTGQWDLAMQGMGFDTCKKYSESKWGYETDGAEWPWETAGAPDAAFDFQHEFKYLTCTEYNGEYSEYTADNLNNATGKFYCLQVDGNNLFFVKQIKNISWFEYLRLRPFIAFKYSDGGTMDPEEPWAPLGEPQAKSLLGEDGRFYATTDDAFAATGYSPVAYVAYYDANNNIEVDGHKYHGLAIGLNRGVKGQYDFDGLNWNQLNEKADVYVSRLKEDVRVAKGLSKWFAPTKDHWQMALEQGFECQFNEDNTVVEAKPGDAYAKIQGVFSGIHLSDSHFYNGFFWTATGADAEKAYYIRFNKGNSVRFATNDKTATEVEGKKMRMRPMIAF